MVRRVYILTAEIAIKIILLPFFSKLFFYDCGEQKNSTNGQDGLFRVCFLEVETFFPVLVAKLISKFRISPGFLNQHSKKPFLPFFPKSPFFFKNYKYNQQVMIIG